MVRAPYADAMRCPAQLARDSLRCVTGSAHCRQSDLKRGAAFHDKSGSNSAPISGQETAQKIRDFSSTVDSLPTFEGLSRSQKRRLQHKRALRTARDAKLRTEIEAAETTAALTEKLSAQEEDFASVAERYKSDRDSLAKQNSSLVSIVFRKV